MTKAATSRRSAYWLHALVYFLLTFGAGYVPLSHLEPLGMSVMGIFLGLLYGWTFIGFIWPSMLSIFALGVCGFFPTPQAAFSNAFSNHLVIFMLLVLVFTAYCEKSGLNRKLSCWFLSRKIVVGRPWTFTFMVLLGSFVVSFLVDGNAVVFLVWNLMYSIFEEVGYKRGERYPAFLLAGVAIAAILSFGCKPWGNVCILAIGALENSSSGAYTVNYLTFMAVTIPICIMFVAAYFVVMKYVFRPDVSRLMNLSDEYLSRIRSELRLNRQEGLPWPCSCCVYGTDDPAHPAYGKEWSGRTAGRLQFSFRHCRGAYRSQPDAVGRTPSAGLRRLRAGRHPLACFLDYGGGLARIGCREQRCGGHHRMAGRSDELLVQRRERYCVSCAVFRRHQPCHPVYP